MARNRRANALPAPAILRLVDTAKACFILEHQADILRIVENFPQFCDSSVIFLRLLPPPGLHSADVCFWAFSCSNSSGAIRSISAHGPSRGLPSYRSPPLFLTHRPAPLVSFIDELLEKRGFLYFVRNSQKIVALHLQSPSLILVKNIFAESV